MKMQLYMMYVALLDEDEKITLNVDRYVVASSLLEAVRYYEDTKQERSMITSVEARQFVEIAQ